MGAPRPAPEPEARLVDYRPAMADDLVAMWRESFEDALGIEDPNPLAEQRRYLEQEVLPTHAVKVMLEGDVIVGFVAASPDTLAQLYVRRGCQARGLGTRLLEWARSRSSGRLVLYTFERNTRACAFYERHGFVAVARGFEPAWGLADVRYEWRRGA